MTLSVRPVSDVPWRRRRAHRLAGALAGIAGVLTIGSAAVHTWGAQAHRLVAHVAAEHLTDTAAAHVASLLGAERLADAATWADRYRDERRDTAPWHYVNIPSEARAYDRERDCPAAAGPSADRGAGAWRDCVVDRIHQHAARLADASLPPSERAAALRFLVHLVADAHQPFHALATARGGNDIPVSAFGSPTCGGEPTPYPCNLHGVWDTTLVARRGLDDRRYLALLAPVVARHRGTRLVDSTPEAWVMESHALARAALLPPGADVDDEYVRRHMAALDERLALAGLRLAALLNRTLAGPPPR